MQSTFLTPSIKCSNVNSYFYTATPTRGLLALSAFPSSVNQESWRTRWSHANAHSIPQCTNDLKSPAPMSSSFQIPDFTKLLPASFELRVNQHCRVASDASLAWSQSEGLLLQPSGPVTEQDDEQSVNSPPVLQTGLLAALCFPTCDFTQLRIAVDLLTLIVHWCDNPEQIDSPVSDRVFERYVVASNPPARPESELI